MAGIALPFPRPFGFPPRIPQGSPPRNPRIPSPIPQQLRLPLAPPRSEGVAVWILASLLFVTAVLNFYVFQVSVVATSAYELQGLHRERDGWRARNEQLQLEVARAHSLRWIEFEAARLGMVKGEEPVYLRVERPAVQTVVEDDPSPLSLRGASQSEEVGSGRVRAGVDGQSEEDSAPPASRFWPGWLLALFGE